jgi:tetratricopeptide (TPR) repeat protein
MRIQDSIRQAKEAASAGDSKAAIAILRDLLKQDPRNVDVWLALADVVDNPDQAKQCYERVLQIDPNNQVAQQRLNKEEPDEFAFLFEMADEPAQDPEYPDESVQELDFSNLSVQPSQTTLEQSQSQDTVTPSIEPSVPAIEETGQRPPPGQHPTTKKRVKKKKGLSRIEIVLIAVLVVVCLCVGVLGIASLGNSDLLAQEPTDLPEDVVAVIYENIRASNAKDFDRYMATIHSRSPAYNATKEGIEMAFSDEYTLSYRVSDVYIVEQSSDRASVHFVLTTRLVSGSIMFRDNQVTGEMQLRKEDGVWKIYNQEVESVDYLD